MNTSWRQHCIVKPGHFKAEPLATGGGKEHCEERPAWNNEAMKRTWPLADVST